MAETNFDVVFSGKLHDGHNANQVRVNLARLFKMDPGKLVYLFSGQPVPIKRGVDEATALQYQAALAKAGALVEIVASGGAPTAAKSDPAPATPPAPKADSRRRAAPVTVPPTLAAHTTPPAAPDYSIAEPGAILTEPVSVPPPAIDTSHLSVAALGETLIPPATVAAPSYDLTGLSLDPPGTTLSERETVEPVRYDLSRLSLAPN